jgi:arylsulfatase A-like enzyme
MPYVSAAALLVTLTAVAGLAVVDIASTLRRAGTYDALSAFTSCLLMALAVGLPVGAVAALIVWPLRTMVSRTQIVGVFAGLALQIVAAVMLPTWGAVAALPVAWVGALLVSRIRQLENLGHLAIVACALVLAFGLTLVALEAFDLQLRFWIPLGLVLVAGSALLTLWGVAHHPQRTRVTVLLLTSFATVATTLLIWGSPEPLVFAKSHHAGPPNVVIIVLDTARRDHIGAYGHPGGLTPNLDHLAAASTVYDQAISPAEWTVPSHASLFTGLYPATHGASFAHHRWLDDRFSTLAEMLRDEGYQTVGLWANYYIESTNLRQGFDHSVWIAAPPGLFIRTAQFFGVPPRWADKGGQRGADALRRWLRTTYDPDRPFFLFINLLEPHAQYLPPFAERRRYLPPDVTYPRATVVGARFQSSAWLAGAAHTAADERVITALYEAEMAYLDTQVGRLLSLLDDAVDPDNTLLIVTADHGENLGEATRWSHGFAVNDHLVRVPLIIRYPPRFPAGLRITGQCQTIDVVPTVFDVLGRPAPVAGLPGRSLTPPFQARRDTFIESTPFFDVLHQLVAARGLQRDASDFTDTLRAIRTDRFKYVWSSAGDDRLYDLTSDPDEAVNVLPEYPVQARELRERLFAWWESAPKYTPEAAATAPQAGAPLSPADRDRLRMLGYGH